MERMNASGVTQDDVDRLRRFARNSLHLPDCDMLLNLAVRLQLWIEQHGTAQPITPFVPDGSGGFRWIDETDLTEEG